MVDYIIVGGGSSACTIAARLSEDPDVSVLVLEQGPGDRNPYIHMPVGYYKTAQGNLLSRYPVQPVRYRKDEGTTSIQARVLGGGSSVNAMVYNRGVPADYDGWATDGAEGWSFREVLPYFIRSESNERFAGEYHGTEGPLAVSDQRYTHYLTKAWLKACQEAGIPHNPDFNAGHQPGCGLYQVTMRNGRRCSAAVAYLRPALRRPNLTLKTGARIARIVVENGCAVGVEAVEGGISTVIRAEREVIVCCGGIGSPHLLLASGIGPADHLSDVGVPVVHDLPGVGENLQDHFDVYMIYDLTGPHSYDKYKKPHWKLWAGLQYALFRDGPVTSNLCEGGLFWYGDADDPLPNLQYHFLPGAGVESGVDTTPSGNGCTLSVYQTRPRSRGTIRLRGADPLAPPLLDPNHLGETYDIECLAEGVRIGQEIMAQASMKPYVGAPHLPATKLATQEERMRHVREVGQGALHPSGACRMGTDDMAVVDPQLRVRGLEGLRVADVSVMPRLISGNTNSVAIMVGERAADFMKGNRGAASD